MEIVYALMIGAVWGLAAHFIVPGRARRGAAIGPFAGAVIGGLTWLVMTWAGVGTDSAWLWIVAFFTPLLSFVVVGALTATRRSHDERARAALRV
ncbi:hypothetical protein ACFQRL_06520 [Microbacterium fluvii]|uniref:Integral membrane protein n=1 Tax=Microbacterium fluvii TaxID=415215 RepID=A0ABW2HBX0_9MICO|nr:hypothetical protein [Microbacterium fluvii]MCU4672238.1 hypothetical protein [Microbacterium fluvii]